MTSSSRLRPDGTTFPPVTPDPPYPPGYVEPVLPDPLLPDAGTGEEHQDDAPPAEPGD